MAERSRCAFALYANGAKYERYKENAIRGLRTHVKGVDIVELDVDDAKPALECLKGQDRPYFMRMAIPLVDDMRRYDRIVWIDSDTDVVSDRFAEILDVETSDDGLAAAPDLDQSSRMRYMKEKNPCFSNDAYVNSGVMVFDIRKIDRDEWKRRMSEGIQRWIKGRFGWHDQDVFNLAFKIKQIDIRYNYIWRRGSWTKDGAFLVHYADPSGHKKLDKIIVDRNSTANVHIKD